MPMITISGNEGTSYWICTYCEQPCDLAEEPFDKKEFERQAKEVRKTFKPVTWQDEVAQVLMDILANPSYDCNPHGSYDVEPLLKVIKKIKKKCLKHDSTMFCFTCIDERIEDL